MPNNNAELYGWIFAILLSPTLSLLVFLFLKALDPEIPWKMSIACFIGCIPGNVISFWYLHYSIDIINAFMIFIVCEVVQAIFIAIVSWQLVKMFGFMHKF